MSEDIFSAKMKCEQCEYNTDTYIPKESTVTEKIQLECGTNDFEEQFMEAEGVKLSKEVEMIQQHTKKVEVKLVTEVLTGEFHGKFNEFTRLGTLRELSQREVESWVGPRHNGSIQHVLMPDNKKKVKLATEGLTEEFHEIKEFTRLGTLRELSRHETDSRVVSDLKAATTSCRKSISTDRVEEKAVKEPTKTLKRKKARDEERQKRRELNEKEIRDKDVDKVSKEEDIKESDEDKDLEADQIDKETEKEEVEKKDKKEIERLKQRERKKELRGKEKEKEKEKKEQETEEKRQEGKDKGVGAEDKKPDRKDRDDRRQSYKEKREDRRNSAKDGKKETVKEEVIPEVKEGSMTKRLGKKPNVLRYIWVLLWFMGDRDRYRDMVLNDVFVDDLVSAGELTEVLRFRGNRDKDTGKRDDTVVQTKEQGGLWFKAMQKRGEQDNEQLELLGGVVLGLGWSSERDMFVFQLAINVSPWKKKQPTGIFLKVMLRRLFSKE